MELYVFFQLNEVELIDKYSLEKGPKRQFCFGK